VRESSKKYGRGEGFNRVKREKDREREREVALKWNRVKSWLIWCNEV